MDKFIGYLIAKMFEFIFFTIAFAIYASVAFPSTNPDWMKEIYLSFAIVLTFFVVSLYVLTSLAAHLIFQDKQAFGLFCAGAYVVSVLIFVLLNPMGGLENFLVFTLPLPVIYLIGSLAKRLALKLRPKVSS